MKLFSLKLIIYLIFALAFIYILSVYLVYQRMPVDQKIYFYVTDKNNNESVTPLPIPDFINKLLWNSFGGKSEVINQQNRNGKPFLFLMNLVDDAIENKDIKLKLDKVSLMAHELFCVDIDKKFTNTYKDYARKTNNLTLTKYLKKYEKTGLCN